MNKRLITIPFLAFLEFAVLSSCTSTSLDPKHPTTGDAAAAAHSPPALQTSLSVFGLPSPFERTP